MKVEIVFCDKISLFFPDYLIAETNLVTIQMFSMTTVWPYLLNMNCLV